MGLLGRWCRAAIVDRPVRGLAILSVTWLAVLLAAVTTIVPLALSGRGGARPAMWAVPAVDKAPVLMVVGDSISQGSAGDYTWRYRLYRQLQANGLRPEFVGPRHDLYDLVSQREGSADYADPAFDSDHDAVWGRLLAGAENTIGPDMAAAKPRYLLVLLGVNDLMTGGDPVSTEAHMRQFIANARQADGTVRIVLGTLLPTAKGRTEPAFAAEVAQYNLRLVQLAAELSTDASPIRFTNTGREIDVASDLYDGIHPNARGEYKIAAAFAETLAGQFGLGRPFPRPLPDVQVGPRLAPALSAKPGNGSVQLSWAASPGATSYLVWRRVADRNGAFERLPVSFPATDGQWTQTRLTNGVTYEYQVQAVKGSDAGARSNVVRTTPSASVASGN